MEKPLIDPTARPFPIIAESPYRVAFVTLSGSHLYGFPSADSDYDLRGMHVVPAREMLSLKSIRDTFEAEDYVDGRIDCEIVTHDVLKYFRLLLRNNGYVLEQIFSPLVIVEGILPALRPIAKCCITKNHYKHYCGFSKNEWTQFHRQPEKHVKRILYVFRILMTGIYLMRTGRVESNINVLNEEFKLSYIPELIRQKIEGYEHSELAAGHGIDYYQRQYESLSSTLQDEYAKSALPEVAGGYEELDRLLLDLRGFSHLPRLISE